MTAKILWASMKSSCFIRLIINFSVKFVQNCLQCSPRTCFSIFIHGSVKSKRNSWADFVNKLVIFTNFIYIFLTCFQVSINRNIFINENILIEISEMCFLVCRLFFYVDDRHITRKFIHTWKVNGKYLIEELNRSHEYLIKW